MPISVSSYAEFRRQPVACSPCGWSGHGADTQVGIVLADGLMAEYHCPRCGEHLAVAPWALIHNYQQP